MRRAVLVVGLLVAALGGVAAWITLPRWYHTWMPAPVGRTAFPLKHVDAVCDGAGRHDLQPALVAAVIYVESRFDADVRSASGAVGLMQVLPQTAREIAAQTDGFRFRVADLGSPAVNVRYGCYYLRELLDRYHGSLVSALAAYNAGAARVERWLKETDGALTAAKIPFSETRRYVTEVLRAREVYAHLYGTRLQAASARGASTALDAGPSRLVGGIMAAAAPAATR